MMTAIEPGSNSKQLEREAWPRLARTSVYLVQESQGSLVHVVPPEAGWGARPFCRTERPCGVPWKEALAQALDDPNLCPACHAGVRDLKVLVLVQEETTGGVHALKGADRWSGPTACGRPLLSAQIRWRDTVRAATRTPDMCPRCLDVVRGTRRS